MKTLGELVKWWFAKLRRKIIGQRGAVALLAFLGGWIAGAVATAALLCHPGILP